MYVYVLSLLALYVSKSYFCIFRYSEYFYCCLVALCISYLRWYSFILLKLVSAIFYQIFISSPNDSPLKTMKNAFYFIEKALFVLEIFNFLKFFPLLSTLSRFKMTNGSGIIYVMNWFAWICRCNFCNSSKTALHYIIKLGQIIYSK